MKTKMTGVQRKREDRWGMKEKCPSLVEDRQKANIR